MVDVHGTRDVSAAIELGKALEALGVRWLEAPCQPEDIRGQAEIARALSLQVTAGEWLRTVWEWRDWIALRGFDVAMPDVARTRAWPRASALPPCATVSTCRLRLLWAAAASFPWPRRSTIRWRSPTFGSWNTATAATPGREESPAPIRRRKRVVWSRRKSLALASRSTRPRWPATPSELVVAGDQSVLKG